jgi:hypothetical protein
MKLLIPAGTTSKLLRMFVQDSSATDGSGLTGLAYNTSGLVGYYIREGDASATQINSAGATALVDMTVGTWTEFGFKEVDAANLPGLYEIGLPNAVLAAGAASVVVMFRGATNMAPALLEIELDAYANFLSAWSTAVPANFEGTAGHASFAQIMALLSMAHKVTTTNNGNGTATVKVYKSDGSTQFGNDLIGTTAASGDVFTGANDTA